MHCKVDAKLFLQKEFVFIISNSRTHKPAFHHSKSPKFLQSCSSHLFSSASTETTDSCHTVVAKMSRSKPISDARDLFKGTAEGLKTVSDTLSSYYSDQRDRDQRMNAAETARQKSQTPTSTTSVYPTSNPAYKPWSEKVANTVDSLYSRAYDSLLNVNLHEFNPLHDATVCRICMRVDRRYIYYMISMPLRFFYCLRVISRESN